VEGHLDFETAESLLLTAEFQDCRELWYSSNYVFLARMCGPKAESFAAVYKPEAGESPLWDFPGGQLYRREVAAYQFARLLGWDFVPPTVIREGPHGPGSLQLFIQHDRESHFFTQREDPELVPQLQRIAAWDFLANNADRKGGHCLLDEERRIWGIDHGLCFHRDYKLRSVIWDWAGEPIVDEWAADVSRVRAVLIQRAPEAASLLSILDEREVEALLQRMDRLLATRTLPLPGPHRSYPWPLV
jgi:hypothetical protein